MATQIVFTESAGLNELVIAGAALVVTAVQNDTLNPAASADNQIGKYYDGSVYQTSAQFLAATNYKGMKCVFVRQGGQVIEQTVYFKLADIPANGTKVTSAALYKEHASDDAQAVQDGKVWTKYTLTTP